MKNIALKGLGTLGLFVVFGFSVVSVKAYWFPTVRSLDTSTVTNGPSVVSASQVPTTVTPVTGTTAIADTSTATVHASQKPNTTVTEITPEVLGASTTAPSTTASSSSQSSESLTQQIDDQLNSYLAQGKFIGPQGPQGVTGPQGQSGSASGGTYAPISYVQAPNNTAGTTGSIGGFTELSSQDFSTNTATITSNLNVQGQANFSGISLSNALGVGNGGTGNSTLAQYGLLYGNGSGPIGVTSVGNAGQCLISNGANAAPTYQACSNGGTTVNWNQLLNPTANLGLTMGAYTTTYTYGAATGTNLNLFNLTDTANNSGTGNLLNLSTATGSTLNPLNISAHGTTVLGVNASGLVTANNLASSGATITGGSINGTPIGAATTSTGAFTTLQATNLAVTNAINVPSGGTGATTLTPNGVLFGNGTSAVQATVAPTAGQILLGNASGVPVFAALSGDVASVSATGVVTLKNVGTAATYGSASSVPVFTTDAQGRVTGVTNTPVAISTSQITSGQLPIANGGTNSTATPTAGAVAYGTGTAYAFNTAGTANQLLTSGGTGAPTFQNISGLLTAGSNINISGTTNATIAVSSTPTFTTLAVSGTSTIAGLSTTGITTTGGYTQSGTGANTFTGATALNGATTANNFASSGATITGGSVNGTPVGNTTPSTGAFTTISGTSLALTSAITVPNGGTGDTTLTTNGVLFGNSTNAVQVTLAPTAGQILLGNASGVPTFTTASGDATISSIGVITLKNTGTAATYGSASQVPVFTTDAQGRVTGVTNTSIAINANQITSGQLAIANGGTNATATPTAGAIAYGTGSAYAFSAAGTANQILTSGGASTPTFQNIASLMTAGSNINISGTTNATIAVSSTPTFTTIGVTGNSTLGGNVILSAAAPVIDATTGTLSINTVTNKPVTFGTGLVTANNFASSNANVTGGSINGTSIGATTPSTGSFTTLAVSGTSTIAGLSTTGITITGGYTQSGAGANTFTGATALNGATTANNLSSSGATITGGSINGTPIGATTPSAGAFTSLTGSSLALSSALTVPNGGTGDTTLATNGVLYGNGTSAIQATLAPTAGQLLIGNVSGVPTFTSLSGDATLSPTGVITLKNTGTAGTYGSASSVPVFTTDAQGRVTAVTNTSISIAASQITSGQVAIAQGGTNGTATPTAGAVAYGTGTAYAFSAAGNANQLLTSGGAGTPTYQNEAALLTAGSNINITGTTNATIAVTGTPSFSTVGVSGNSTIGGNIILSATTPVIDATTGTLSINTTTNKPTVFGSGLVTANNFTSSNAVITGGSVNGTPIGATTASTGAFTTLTASGTVAIASLTPATNSVNNNSPTFGLQGTYWNGTASATDGWTLQDMFGTGSNPTATLTFAHTGSTGAAAVSFPTVGVGSTALATALNIGSLVQTGTAAYGLAVNAPIGATTNYAATFQGGSVGIGTVTPTAILAIVGQNSSTTPLFNATTSSGVSAFTISSTGTVTATTLITNGKPYLDITAATYPGGATGGAIGDGTTDNCTALTNAAAAAATYGYTLLIPPGNFATSCMISISTNMIGNGVKTSMITGLTNGMTAVVSISGFEFTVKDLTVNANGLATSAVQMYSATNEPGDITVDNVEFLNAVSNGFLCAYGYGIQVQNSLAFITGGLPTPSGSIGIYLTHCSDSKFLNNMITGYSIGIKNTNQGDNRFEDNHAWSYPLGGGNGYMLTAFVDTTGNTVWINNVADNPKTSGFDTSGDGAGPDIIIGNRIQGEQTWHTTGITGIVSGNQGDIISGNYFAGGPSVAIVADITATGTVCPFQNFDAYVTTKFGNFICGNINNLTLTLGNNTSTNNYLIFQNRSYVGYNSGASGPKSVTIQGLSGIGVSFAVNNNTFASGVVGGYAPGGLPYGAIGSAIASTATIAPSSPIVHITGTGTISTITAPSGCTTAGLGCSVTLIPDGLWTTVTGGNIALASAAVVSRQLIMTYDPGTSLWYPSY